MNNSILVWDLETVPDLRGYAAANGMSASTDDEVREDGDKFPKHIYHSIVCIGALVAHRDNGAWIVDALGALHVGAAQACLGDPDQAANTAQGTRLCTFQPRHRQQASRLRCGGH